ncbi:MAG: alpha/beta hydrolase [Sedimentisphaerales bacterium]|nr:alpha/beta hydrolase [Sedimentisphaerales bacterium]
MRIKVLNPVGYFLGGLKNVCLTCSIVLAGMVGGCRQAPPRDEELQRGAVWMFSGVEGGYALLAGARQGLRDAGVNQAIYTCEWGRPFDIFTNLCDLRRNRAVAACVAEEICAYRRNYPTQSIDLIGYSGGGGIVLLVAETLPEDVHLHNVILVHPAVSPDYDLTPALRRLDGQMIHYYSDWDIFILGLGTSVFGTIDRKFTASAGQKGFDLEQAVSDPALRGKLLQCKWTPEQIASGHFGEHFGIGFYGWNKDYVAPHLLAP